MSAAAPFDPNFTLAGIPVGLRDPLVETYNNVVRNYVEGRWEPAELNGGKFCEIVYTILKGMVDGAFAANPSKPPNMVDACRDLERADSARFSRAVRVQIPRMLIGLYEIRNNRGVGHVGGDVDPNHMDAVVVLSVTKWILADLVRAFHNIDISTASSVVEALVERNMPLVWNVAGSKRVLNPSLSYKDKMLVLLYSQHEPVSEVELFQWLEHSNQTVFRRDVLVPAHSKKLIEYDRKKKMIHLSPVGVRHVETNIPLTV